MAQPKLTTLIAFPSWIVGVTRNRSVGYLCWVITPELEVLNDGEVYRTRKAALASARNLVHCSMGPPIDFSQCRLIE